MERRKLKYNDIFILLSIITSNLREYKITEAIKYTRFSTMFGLQDATELVYIIWNNHMDWWINPNQDSIEITNFLNRLYGGSI